MRGRALTLTALAAVGLAAPANSAPGSFTTTEVFGGFGAAAVAIGDFDGGNGPDLAIANKNHSGVSILLNKGDATFNPAPLNPPITTPAPPACRSFSARATGPSRPGRTRRWGTGRAESPRATSMGRPTSISRRATPNPAPRPCC